MEIDLVKRPDNHLPLLTFSLDLICVCVCTGRKGKRYIFIHKRIHCTVHKQWLTVKTTQVKILKKFHKKRFLGIFLKVDFNQVD